MENIRSLVVELPEDIKKMVLYGDFTGADELIEVYLKRNIPQILRDRLSYERHRMMRLKKEYIYPYDEALKMAREKIRDFKEEEFEELKKERYVDWAYIDGEIMFQRRFLENITLVHPDMKERKIENKQEEKDNPEAYNSELLNRTIDEIINEGEKKYFIRIKTGIKLKKEASRIGEKIRVHLPVPKKAQQIWNMKIHETSHKPVFISGSDYPQRTVYYEEELRGEDIFRIEYSYENHIKYNKLDYDQVSSVQPSFYTEEWEPHIVFTPFLVNLAREITGDEKNPLIQARNIYDYITQNVQYSFVREYAAIENIPEYAAYNLKGDCGVQALLFITLCRIVGIPARWQSGLYVTPKMIGCHDWAEFYIEPYGWLFADTSFGGSSYRKGNKKRWNYYFGNLDPFRMVANSAFQYPFLPARKHLRLDPFDNQRGEAEYDDQALYDDGYEPINEIIDVHEIK